MYQALYTSNLPAVSDGFESAWKEAATCSSAFPVKKYACHKATKIKKQQPTNAV